MRNLTLLYQVGIANVFEELRGKPHFKRLMQSDYRSCEGFARGAQWAGSKIHVMHWDHPGDALQHCATWESGAGDLWATQKCSWGLED